MSYVADIILLVVIDDTGVPEAQEWLRANEWPDLKKIDHCAGGNKAMQCDIWAAAINYFDVDEFVGVMQKIKWEDPDSVQLLIKNEHEDKFTLRFGINT